jgi:hypothetical protein
MAALNVGEIVELIRMEYAEMPGLRLTFWQAQRLWNVSEDLCDRALRVLIAAQFLNRTADGAYVRYAGTLQQEDVELLVQDM